MAEGTKAIKSILWATLALGFIAWILSIIGLAGGQLVCMCGYARICCVSRLSGRCTHVSVAVAGLQRDCYGNEEAVAVAARGKGCNAVRASPSL
jgi:hypothetical protein